MSYFCQITDLERPTPGQILVRWEMRHATTLDLIERGAVSFGLIAHDANGAPIDETLLQKRARLRAELDAFFDAKLSLTAIGDTVFEQLREQAIGYRYPAN